MTTKRSIRWNTWLAWSPILLLALYVLVLAVLPSSLKCSPINDGGTEMMCGLDYGHPALKFAAPVVWSTCFALSIIAAFFALRRQLTILGMVGLVISIAVGLLLAYMWWTFRNECTP